MTQDREALAREHVSFAHDLVKARAEQGFVIHRAQALLQEAQQALEAGSFNQALRLAAQASAAARSARMRPDFPYREPSTLEEIRAALPGEGASLPAGPEALSPEAYLDRCWGGWLGKNIGGALGGPVEGWPREKILATYGEVWDYVQKPPSTLNDDTAYEVLALHALEEYGLEVTSEQLGLEWVEHLPQAYTAERVALENLRRGIMPPESALWNNPYSEWIGGQMKGEIWGLIAPGLPEAAMEYAYRDGIIAHEKNGVYGEIFDAVLISAAFVEPDPRRLLEIGLSYVPEQSRFAEVVRRTTAWCDAPTWQEAWAQVEATYAKDYHPVHTFPAIAAVVIGLLYGNGEFEKALCITNMCGLDTDCTAGQTGAIMGVICGAATIPPKWKDPVGDDFDTYVIGFEKLKTSEVAQRTCAIGRQVTARGRH